MEGLSTSWVRPEVGWLLCGSACLRLRRVKSRHISQSKVVHLSVFGRGNWRRFFLSRGGLRLFGLRALFDTRGGCYSNPFSCIVLGGGDGCTAVSRFYL
ncbi:hypothetical protein F2Q70_00010761 [Brassica cretica]|uniref:Uncharacterized protein n=1 Tax=Brassica cretica TaxID=69181 RepID=A0A8S9MBT1_BRACR|nr:hypothetical protein F2Q70_00010761 [Brassica cretica]